jgi:hypothetical protein
MSKAAEDLGFRTYRCTSGEDVGIVGSFQEAPGAEWQEIAGSVYSHLDSGLRDRAEAVLFSALSASDIETFRKRMAADPEGWPYQGGWHFAGGMAIRNLLRKLRFGEEQLGVANLDDCYVNLLEGAVRRAATAL